MAQTDAQIAFQARINRILLAQGADLSHVALRQDRRQHRAIRTVAVLLAVVFSFGLGAASVFATRIMRFYQGDLGLHYDWIVLDASISIVMLVILSGIFHLRRARYGYSMALGAAAMLSLMHNAVWYAPFFFADLFSHTYVGAVKQETDPMTVWLWVTSITIPSF